jgi:hypothetical protein
MPKPRPRYPIYIPSKGRAHKPRTARMFDEENVPYQMVVQPDQVEDYREWAERGMLLVLPRDNMGLVYARNWIKDHSISEGHERHWQFDDDIKKMYRLHLGRRLPCSVQDAVVLLENFVDRYENVALASFNSMFFMPAARGLHVGQDGQAIPPFYLNFRCYTCFLMMNALPNRWRHLYNEDTDMTLQVLSDGWCTILFNVFLIHTEDTKTNATRTKGKGGGQAQVYAGDGRLQMARQLERVWPGVVETYRRFDRPQHKVKNCWRSFDNQLIRRKDIDWSAIEKQKDSMRLRAVEKPKSEALEDLVTKYG